MQLPASLTTRIESLIEGKPMKALQQRWAEMSLAYRAAEAPELDDLSALAYLVGRLPATFAACVRALELATQLEKPQMKTQLDVGAGPGAAIWAARALWPDMQSRAMERAPAWLRLGPQVTPNVDWQRMDLSVAQEMPKADLVTAGYVLNELSEGQVLPVVKRLWAATQQWLVLVEPGTPAGYARLLAVRDALCAEGAHVVAPCPGHVLCPLQHSKQWCHFGIRLNRPRFQRVTKEAEVSWEDERFSFMVLSRSPVPVPEGRALHFPQKRGGHVWVELCTPEGLDKRVLSRRNGSLYKAARRMHWGDAFPPPIQAGEAESENEFDFLD
jgi:ribosomal protein RSM22 (predicted rRNA methylase)